MAIVLTEESLLAVDLDCTHLMQLLQTSVSLYACAVEILLLHCAAFERCLQFPALCLVGITRYERCTHCHHAAHSCY